MTVPVYTPILDAEVAPDAPGTTSLFTRLRDNLLAVVGGDSAAPSISPGIIAAAGIGTDGILTASTTFSGSGYYEFASANITAPLTVPVGCVIRVNGDFVLSSTITVTPRKIDSAISGGVRSQAQIAEDNMLAAMGIALGPNGTFDATNSGGGANGGNGGDGTTTNGGKKLDFTNFSRPWVAAGSVGGNGGGLGNGSGGSLLISGNGGGCLVIIVEGNATLTGGTISVDGRNSDNTGPGGSDPGGGAGGTVKFFCTGTITNGTFSANGGTGNNIPSAGGGGGFVYLVAPAYAGTRTITVTKGVGATNGSDGVSSTTTMARGDLRSILSRRF